MKRELTRIDTNGITLEAAVAGDGPLVILLHGFPQCWYLWRHQIEPIVAAGYRVVVPNQRGYGQSDRPPAIEDYNIRLLAADVAGIAAALGYEEFVVVGHDWGCIVAWHTALLHGDTCRAVMGMSVPLWRIGDGTVNPPGMDGRFWYIRYFQPPGVAEAALERDIAASLYAVHYNVSADAPKNAFMRQLAHPDTCSLIEALPAPPATLPSWLSRADLDYYVEQFTASGFRGPVNWYRNMPTLNATTPELDGRRIAQPAAFVAGEADPVLGLSPNWRTSFVSGFEDLRFIELIDGAGHWLQVEQPNATTAQILRFLRDID